MVEAIRNCRIRGWEERIPWYGAIGFVYDLQYENGNVDVTVYTIDSVDLNNGLNTIYEADGSAFWFHFHYVNNPAVLIEYFDGEEAKFDAASIDDTLKIKEIYESNR